jgi:hypothetical protein
MEVLNVVSKVVWIGVGVTITAATIWSMLLAKEYYKLMMGCKMEDEAE